MSHTRTRTLVVSGLFIVAGSLALAVWTPWSTADDAAETSTWAPVYRALCDAGHDADQGRAAAARRVFYDQAHEPLHTLARVATADHRDAAARLLEAKERVETLLDAPTSALADQLRRLARGTRTAANAIGEPVGASCAEAG